MNTKMQWLINDIQNGKDNRPLGAQMVNFKMNVFPRGIVQAPTGYGKSAIIIRNIVDQVRYAMAHRKKLVITISTPLLVLNDQFYTDLVDVLVAVFPNLNYTNCVFVDNSCVKAQQVGNVKGSNIPKWGMANLNAALQNKSLVDYVFVVSTHKSYNNLLSQSNGFLLSQLKTLGYQMITYFDEAHLIIDGSVQQKLTVNTNAKTKSEDDADSNTNGNAKSEDEVDEQIYMSQLDIDADCIYFITATPSKWSAQWFIDHQKPVNIPTFDGFVSRVTISQAIQEEAILPINVNLVEVVDNKDIATLGTTLEEIMKLPKTIKHRKVLVTCMNSAELQLLKDELVFNRGIPVALTSSIHGKQIHLTNGKCIKNTNMSISRFSKFIKAFPGNMVILHIRQMTAGVDCSAITSVTNRVFDNTAKNCVKMIQTNGRALRLAERGIPVAQMAKQFGEVFDIVNKKTFNENARFLIRFYNVIYGTQAVKVFRLNMSTTKVLMQQPSVLQQLPAPIGTAPNWSAPHFYALQLLQDRMKFEKTLGQQDPSLQDPILTDLLAELDKIAKVNLAGDTDWSWYAADHLLSPMWDMKVMKAMRLF